MGGGEIQDANCLRRVHELLIFITGYEDDDELSLAEFLRGFVVLLAEVTKNVGKGKLTEAALEECHGKVGTTLEVVVNNGVVNTTDVSVVHAYMAGLETKNK